ncbi:hypothetical protein C3941_09195 [Kaistia algarum]|nr:hypothetical protein C3941_09195 [Kaistia algarum]
MSALIHLSDYVPSAPFVTRAVREVQIACGDWQLEACFDDEEPSVLAVHRLGFEIGFYWSRDGWVCVDLEGSVLLGPWTSLESLLREAVLPKRPWF